jgi:hypothetical protein
MTNNILSCIIDWDAHHKHRKGKKIDLYKIETDYKIDWKSRSKDIFKDYISRLSKHLKNLDNISNKISSIKDGIK